MNSQSSFCQIIHDGTNVNSRGSYSRRCHNYGPRSARHSVAAGMHPIEESAKRPKHFQYPQRIRPARDASVTDVATTESNVETQGSPAAVRDAAQLRVSKTRQKYQNSCSQSGGSNRSRPAAPIVREQRQHFCKRRLINQRLSANYFDLLAARASASLHNRHRGHGRNSQSIVLVRREPDDGKC